MKCHFKFPKIKIFLRNQIEYFDIVEVLQFFIFPLKNLIKINTSAHKCTISLKQNFIKGTCSAKKKEVFRYLQY